MKNLLSIILFLSFAIESFSQKSKKEIFRFWDSAGNQVKEKNARLFTNIQYLNDTCWLFQRYKMMAPMMSSNEYKDKEGKILHGRSSFMREDGTLDSTGHFVNGKPDGMWLYFTNEGNVALKKEYSMGELLSTWNTAEKNGDKKNSVDTKPDVEAQFPGSAPEWQRYLIRNLRYPQYAFERKMQGRVEIYFQVDTDGSVHDEMPLKSVEFSLDNEAMRLITASPKWIPATKNGQKVKSYKQQSILFRLEYRR